MSAGSIKARHFRTGSPVELHWKDGRITSVEPIADAPPNLWVAPALLDLQINGFAGVDFQQDNLKAQDLLAAAKGLQAAGCTRFLLTLITDQWPRLMARLGHLKQLRDSSTELQGVIAGWHLEGPFLSA